MSCAVAPLMSIQWAVKILFSKTLHIYYTADRQTVEIVTCEFVK